MRLPAYDPNVCRACDRVAITRNAHGHPICARHAGHAADNAGELAREKAMSARRVGAIREEAMAIVRAAIAKIDRPNPMADARARGRQQRVTLAMPNGRKRERQHDAATSEAPTLPVRRSEAYRMCAWSRVHRGEHACRDGRHWPYAARMPHMPTRCRTTLLPEARRQTSRLWARI